MSTFCFEFLHSFSPDIVEECKKLDEDIISSRFAGAVIKGRSIAEDVVVNIAKNENINIGGLTQYDKIKKLIEYKILDPSVQKPLDDIRRNANNVAHNSVEPNLELSLRIRRKLYDVLVWYYTTYCTDEGFKKNYVEIDFKSNESSAGIIKEIIDKKLNDLHIGKGSSLEHTETEEFPPKTNNKHIPNFNKIKGSYLLGELSRLKSSSHEAVEGNENLNDFKEYMHVERPIQNEFLATLKEVKDKNSNQLVMLCGSVGDGKSHLISYLNKHHSDIIGCFKIHSDATESYDPDKSSIDTLAQVLTSFDDEHINNSNEKLILAINLGVLNNFMESTYAKQSYTQLKEIFDKSEIFNSEKISSNHNFDPVHIISFSDYNLFELYEDGVDSKYLNSLFHRITDSNEDNSFYQAYLADCKNGYVNPIINNYELFMNPTVQNEVIQLIIKSLLQYKRIVSTRELLNFVYEIIVPPKIHKYDKTYDLLDCSNELLPNLLYTNSDQSNLLYLISLHDPINLRREALDKFLIDLNLSSNLNEVVMKYLIDSEDIKFLNQYLNTLQNVHDLRNLKDELINTIVRFSSVMGKDSIKNKYTENSYREYISYLYNFNKGNYGGYKKLFNKVIGAVFKWRGSPKKNFILIDGLPNFNVYEEVVLKPKLLNFNKNEDDLNNRFKRNILLNFTVNLNDNTILTLSLDYNLFVIIDKLNKGYKPNKNEKEDLVIFQEFIDNVIDGGKSEELLLIEDIENDTYFTLEYDVDFEEFAFKRGDI